MRKYNSFLFCLPFLVCVYGPQIPNALRLILFFCCAGAAIVFFIYNKNRKNSFLSLAILLCCSTVFGLIFEHTRSLRTVVSFGMPIERIQRYQGRLLEDSYPVSNQKTLIRMSLVKTYSDWGSASAYGEVICFVSGHYSLRWGSTVAVTGGFKLGKKNKTIGNGNKIAVQTDGNPFFRIRNRIRYWLDKQTDKLPLPVYGFFQALFYGTRDELDPELLLQFRKSGCLAVLALSGQHLTILTALLLFFLKPLRGKWPAVMAACLFVLFYLFLAGLIPSLYRSVVFFLVQSLLTASGRKTHPINVLFFSFFVAYLLYPCAAQSLSFQLSFAAMAGLVILGGKIELELRSFIPKSLAQIIAGTLGAFFFTLPIVLYYFKEIYPIGLIAGILLIPLITVFLWIGFVFLLACCICIYPFVSLLQEFLAVLYSWICSITKFFGAFPCIQTAQWFPCLCFVTAFVMLLYRKNLYSLLIKPMLRRTH